MTQLSPDLALKVQLGLSTAMIQNITMMNYAIKDINIRSLEFQVFSQFGEDGIINFLCQALHVSKPSVLEIGVEDFQECNSHFLGYSRNASIVAVDKYPLHEDFLSKSSLRWKNTVEAWTRDVTPDNINDIYKDCEVFLGAIDIFSLDIDGIDFWVFKRLENINAKILILEYNALYGSKRSVSVPFEENFDRTQKHFSNKYYGCSLLALIDEADKKGYQFIGSNRACNNAFFIKQNLVSAEAFQVLPLQEYTDLTFRESRDFEGELTYFNSKLELDAISKMPLVDMSTNQLIKVGDL